MVAMTLMGFVHFGHGAVQQMHQSVGHHGLFGHHGHGGIHAGGHGAVHGSGPSALPGHAQGGSGAAPIAHGHGSGTHPAQGATHASDSISKSSQHVVSHEHYSSILGFIPSPIDVCSLLTGAGLTGMLLQSYLPLSTLWVV